MKYNVCVVGPRSLAGETLLEILEERAFPVADLHVLDTGDEVAETVSFAGREHIVRDIGEFDFSRARLAFFCGDAALSREYAPRATAAGCLVIDGSEAFRLDPEVPLVVPEVNPEALARSPAGGLVASPDASALLLAITLKPLASAFGLESVSVVTMESVSGRGRAAVEELARQSMALFNQTGISAEIFPKQIAFNLLPLIGAEDTDGHGEAERSIVAETRRLLGLPELPMDVTRIRVPVFYGHAIAVHARTRRIPTREAAQRVLEAADGLVVYQGTGSGEYPTPVLEAATNDPVFVGRIRLSPADAPKGVAFWAVVDNTRKGAALNWVQIAEKLVQSRPDSPLM